ncbi:hypothetical protein GCM10009117_15140 [Gangjinia marincola]|uniref:SatD family (SatD) n=1 Tax=Gangjinia marincola TaxID=578463 RepID=A0ABN1MGT5_9FLAO
MNAVITADFIASSALDAQELDLLLDVLSKEFKALQDDHKVNIQFKISRGDSFQGVVGDPGIALKVLLQLKTAIAKITFDDKSEGKTPDFRAAIGIGDINLTRDSVLESNGEAFQYSGRTLDQMKGDQRTALTTGSDAINQEFLVSLTLMDSVMSKWSAASFEVAYYVLKNWKEVDIAKELSISQSAVNTRKKVANWDAIKLLMDRFNTVITSYTSPYE